MNAALTQNTNLHLLLLVSVLVAAGCSGKEEQAAEPEDGTQLGLTEAQAEEVLATVGDREITVGEFAERLASQSPYLRARFESPERRREFLDNYIRFELLVLEAKRRGYEDRPEIKRARRQAMVQQFIKTEVDAKLQLSDVSQADMKAYYEAHKGEYDRPAQVRASQIVVKDKKTAERLLKKATAKRDLPEFRKLAREYSQDEATAAGGGDLQFFAAEGGDGPPPQIRKVAFSLRRTGNVYSKLVKTDAGYHIVALTGKRPQLTRTFEQAKRSIRHKLLKEKKDAAMEALLAKLRSEIKVEVDTEALKEIKVEAPGSSGAGGS